ncbi:MAG TPA: Gfo/Idh/MocA family oxidoreductase [Bacillota bacterium]
MKIAVIGGGKWGKNIIRTLYQLGVLAAVADSSEAVCNEIKASYPEIHVVSDYQTVLNSNITAVVIATPVPSHYQIAKKSLAAGKDVFIEKPMTLSKAEAEELVILSEQAKKILMVGHLLLYQPAVQWIKERLDAGLLGEVSGIHLERLGLGRARETENVLWDLGVHDLAVISYLTGMNPRVSQIIGQSRLRPNIEDDIYLHLIINDHLQAHLHISWLWPKKHRQLTITGTKGMLVYNELEQTVTLYHNGINKLDLSIWDHGAELVYKGDGTPLVREMEHFITCVKERKPPISDGPSGMAVIKLLEEASQRLKKSAP